MIFTKRSTSIIATGEDIHPHEKFTGSLDYEGEIGVIIGKAGFMIDESNALDHVWGYTIINGKSCRIQPFCSVLRFQGFYPLMSLTVKVVSSTVAADTSCRCDRPRKAERSQTILHRKVG